MTRRAAVLALLACALAALAIPSLAAADGDPASDVLLGENVFYPYSPPVPQAVQDKLNLETAAAMTAGFPIKVALIAAPPDLGVLPSLFGHPQAYADFLDKEISFRGPQPLLVVMAKGYGLEGVGGPAKQAIAVLAKPAGKTSADLAQAAVTVVAKLATASGHPLTAARRRTASASAGASPGRTVLLVILILAAIVVASALVALRVRQSAG